MLSIRHSIPTENLVQISGRLEHDMSITRSVTFSFESRKSIVYVIRAKHATRTRAAQYETRRFTRPSAGSRVGFFFFFLFEQTRSPNRILILF